MLQTPGAVPPSLPPSQRKLPSARFSAGLSFQPMQTLSGTRGRQPRSPVHGQAAESHARAVLGAHRAPPQCAVGCRHRAPSHCSRMGTGLKRQSHFLCDSGRVGIRRNEGRPRGSRGHAATLPTLRSPRQQQCPHGSAWLQPHSHVLPTWGCGYGCARSLQRVFRALHRSSIPKQQPRSPTGPQPHSHARDAQRALPTSRPPYLPAAALPAAGAPRAAALPGPALPPRRKQAHVGAPGNCRNRRDRSLPGIAPGTGPQSPPWWHRHGRRRTASGAPGVAQGRPPGTAPALRRHRPALGRPPRV